MSFERKSLNSEPILKRSSRALVVGISLTAKFNLADFFYRFFFALTFSCLEGLLKGGDCVCEGINFTVEVSGLLF